MPLELKSSGYGLGELASKENRNQSIA